MSIDKDAVINLAQIALEDIRPAIPLLTEWDPVVGATVAALLPVLFEGLVGLRSALSNQTDEEQKRAVRAKITEAVQAMAAAKFGGES
jgi:hypothetical protein